MIDRDHDLSVTRQARVLNISRSSVYYLPRPTSPGELALMRRIDELHLDYPFAGARMLRDLLGREGLAVGRLHVSTLMKRMGMAAVATLYLTPVAYLLLASFSKPKAMEEARLERELSELDEMAEPAE